MSYCSQAREAFVSAPLRGKDKSSYVIPKTAAAAEEKKVLKKLTCSQCCILGGSGGLGGFKKPSEGLPLSTKV